MELDPVVITSKVTHVLEQLGLRYFIGGSIASTLYGMVRTTQDVDLIVDLDQKSIDPFVLALETDFYVDIEMVIEAVIRRASFNIIHRDSFFKVDFFIPEGRFFVEQQFSRSIRQTLSIENDITAQVASPEDTVLAKLEWFRMGGEVSERQWRDVIGILKVQGENLDLKYLNQMAEILGIIDLLEKVLGQKLE